MSLQTEAEKRHIDDLFHDLLMSFRYRKLTNESKVQITKAFEFANEAHMGVRRKSGEPYILHPLSVAKIVTHDIGLGTTSAIAAILHDVVEDTDYTVQDIESIFGKKVALLVDGLTKISGSSYSIQAENFKKMLLTLSDDVRVILIKLADRLHNMRTLDLMPRNKQLKISGETLYVYAPLAHRFGLYIIKSELEDLSLKFKLPEVYNNIQLQLHDNRKKLDHFVDIFTRPIKKKLKEEKFNFSISGRTKSIYSIWGKMQAKNIPFSEIYDLYAVRIVFDPAKNMDEKRQCFDILSLITDIYRPKQERLRDWITTPKSNGYRALHITVMGQEGRWVEVQIRSKEMDEVAEWGFAAHYNYKEKSHGETELGNWLGKIRELLQNPESNALDFLDEFKLNLYSQEVVVFTPKGEMRQMPKNATVLDMAYEIHTDLGNKCIGAKVNHHLVSISHILKSGDQIEILSSSKQKPKPEWLSYAITARAKSKIKSYLKQEQDKYIEKGMEAVTKKLDKLNIKPSSHTLRKIIRHFSLNSKEQLYTEVGLGLISLDNIKEILYKKSEKKVIKFWRLLPTSRKTNKATVDRKKTFLLKEGMADYTLATCCNPIPGDDVAGYISEGKKIFIHKKSCPEAISLMSKHGDSVIDVEWTRFKVRSYLSHVHIRGIDKQGIVNSITNIVSNEYNINMRSISFDAHDGTFEGNLFLYVHHTEDLQKLISKLSNIKGVEAVGRVAS